MKTKLSVVITKEDKLYVGFNPETGVASQGTTIDGALANLKEAVELYLEETGTKIHFEPVYLTTIETS